MSFNVAEAESIGLQILQSIRDYGDSLNAGREVPEDALSILTACKELQALVTSPADWVFQMSTAHYRSIAVCLLLDWNLLGILAKAGGELSLGRLGDILGVSKPMLRCTMRECVSQKIIGEPLPEVYQLNKNSQFLLDPEMSAIAHHYADVGLRAGAYIPDYIARTKGSLLDSPHTTSFQAAFGNHSFYDFHRNVDQTRGARFDTFMESCPRSELIESFFPFNNLGPGSVVVDVGGGRGHHSIRLATEYPQLSLVVQDCEIKMPPTQSVAEEAVLERVKWQQHDYFNEQHVIGADVYLLSNILMDQTPA
ncbi:hypothetical protein FE257_010760 [Aspergillus nanangensis]|uniref:O-methyltransferase C-terminal domain-containing protein n=1 Tax=Aspergillus nanangensis TaxID=2582783 RepID=A0AAD4CX72_ASPNN|nr:hypothetical protein FE257_010760 [Aspergillus nanangensis]